MSRTRNLKGFLIVPVGTVESFSIKAGYGFVKLDNGESCFFKYSDIHKAKELDMLKVGQKVRLVRTVNKRGVKICEIFPVVEF